VASLTIVLVLDPCLKTLLLEKELGDMNTQKVIRTIKELLYEYYPAKPAQRWLIRKEERIIIKP
jgi:hypothetical protein